MPGQSSPALDPLTEDDRRYSALDTSPATTDSNAALPIQDVRYPVRWRHGGYAAWLERGYGGGGGRLPAMPRGSRLNPDTGIQPRGFGLDPTRPEDDITDGQGGLSDTLKEALNGGVKFIAHMLGGPSAMSTDPNQADAHHAFRDGAFATSPEDLAAAKKAVNPQGTLTDSLNNLVLLDSAYRYYRDKGQLGEAHVVLASLQEALQDGERHAWRGGLQPVSARQPRSRRAAARKSARRHARRQDRGH